MTTAIGTRPPSPPAVQKGKDFADLLQELHGEISRSTSGRNYNSEKPSPLDAQQRRAARNLVAPRIEVAIRTHKAETTTYTQNLFNFLARTFSYTDAHWIVFNSAPPPGIILRIWNVFSTNFSSCNRGCNYIADCYVEPPARYVLKKVVQEPITAIVQRLPEPVQSLLSLPPRPPLPPRLNTAVRGQLFSPRAPAAGADRKELAAAPSAPQTPIAAAVALAPAAVPAEPAPRITCCDRINQTIPFRILKSCWNKTPAPIRQYIVDEFLTDRLKHISRGAVKVAIFYLGTMLGSTIWTAGTAAAGVTVAGLKTAGSELVAAFRTKLQPTE